MTKVLITYHENPLSQEQWTNSQGEEDPLRGVLVLLFGLFLLLLSFRLSAGALPKQIPVSKLPFISIPLM